MHLKFLHAGSYPMTRARHATNRMQMGRMGGAYSKPVCAALLQVALIASQKLLVKHHTYLPPHNSLATAFWVLHQLLSNRHTNMKTARCEHAQFLLLHRV
jgi:hypothetical protein